MRHDNFSISGALLVLAATLAACSGEAAPAGSQETPTNVSVQPSLASETGDSAIAAATPQITSTEPAAFDAEALAGLSFAKARDEIVRQGWKPFEADCIGGGTSPAICSDYPEIETCSGTGQGFCSLKYTGSGRCLTVVTVGGPPGPQGSGDTAVDGANISNEACAQDLG